MQQDVRPIIVLLQFTTALLHDPVHTPYLEIPFERPIPAYLYRSFYRVQIPCAVAAVQTVQNNITIMIFPIIKLFDKQLVRCILVLIIFYIYYQQYQR